MLFESYFTFIIVTLGKNTLTRIEYDNNKTKILETIVKLLNFNFKFLYNINLI